MAKRFTRSQRLAQAKRELKSQRGAQLKTLKSLGLVSKRANLKNKSTRIKLLSKFSDVLQRRAKVVTVPKGFAIRQARKNFRVQGMQIVVPHRKGEHVRIDRGGNITATRHIKGHRVKRILHFGGEMPKPPRGKKFMFSVPFANGQKVRFDDLDALRAFMQPYAEKTYKDWQDYMEIEEVDDDEAEGASDDE